VSSPARNHHRAGQLDNKTPPNGRRFDLLALNFKPQHWRVFSSKNAPNGSLMLEFCVCTSCAQGSEAAKFVLRV
jgi:hypothetical protein